MSYLQVVRMGRQNWLYNDMCLCIIFLIISSFASLNHGGMQNDQPMDMQHHMYLKEAVIKTFEIDNHIIDCIDIYQQPAFQHPLLVNHTLQLKPNYPSKTHDYASKAPLPWNSSKICPNGSIPIERIQGNDHFTRNHLVNHTYKHPHYFMQQKDRLQPGTIKVVHEHSRIQVVHDFTYGLKATLNVWNPNLEKLNEFSVSQVWFVGGDLENTLEAGWAVLPSLYGNTDTRFFVRWSADHYKSGCYNLQCRGFVQSTSRAILGSYLRPVSVYGGPQYAIDIEIFQDKKTGNWWLILQDMEIGYWPKELFPYLLNGADSVYFGGEVGYNHATAGPHTSAQMGSGHFAKEGFGKACFVKNVQILDGSFEYHTPPHVVVGADAEKCYDLEMGQTYGPWGLFFYFGGPGRSDQCT